MAFIKVKAIDRDNEIINTDMINTIFKFGDGSEYTVEFCSDGCGRCYDGVEVKKIFDAIGVSLD